MADAFLNRKGIIIDRPDLNEVHMTLPRYAFALALFATASGAAAQEPWTVRISTTTPVPIGSCSAIRVDIIDPATRDVPRAPNGDRVTVADFDIAITGESVAVEWQDGYHVLACACQGGSAGAEGLITATYPSSSLAQGYRVPGVELKTEGSFTLGRPLGDFNPLTCTDSSAPRPSITRSPLPATSTTSPTLTTTTTTASPTEAIAIAPGGIRATQGPVPTGLKLVPHVPIIASLVWDAMPNAISYSLRRGVGTAAPIVRVTRDATGETGARDTIPDPRDTYLYSLFVTYADGSINTSPTIAFVSPPLRNPSGFTAKDLGEGNVDFQWQAVGGALSYRLDGPGFPSTGLSVTNATGGTFPTPPGANSWKLTTLYQGNFADYANPSTASAVVRVLPPHPGQWLTKSNGPGSQDNVQMPKEGGFSCWYLFCVYNKVFVPHELQHPYDPNFAVFLGASLEQDYSTDLVNKPVGLTAWLAAGPTFKLWDNPFQFPIEAVYGNPGDLGVGRRSFCAQVNRTEGFTGVFTVCYAAAHGIAAGEPGFNDPSVITNPREGQGDDFLLAMVITKEPTGSVFMVFGPGAQPLSTYPNAQSIQGKYKLSPTVTLDSEGPKYVPHACLSCHGGKYNDKTHKVDGASFLPIDPGLQSFASEGDKAIQQERIRRINEMIVKSGSAPAVISYINGLYGNQVSVPGRTAIPDFVPTGWQAQSGFYRTLVRPYCATCHLAAPAALSFASWANFSDAGPRIKAAVCTAHTMPHAEIQYKAFWTKDTGPVYLPGLLASTLNWDGNTPGAPPSCP